MSTASEFHSSDRLVQRVAAAVRAEASRRGHTQAHVGALLGISQTQVSARYRAEVPLTLEQLEVLADAWRVDVRELMPPRPAGVLALASAQNAYGPSPMKGRGRRGLPQLDSNQQPAGCEHRPLTSVPSPRSAPKRLSLIHISEPTRPY